MLYIKVICLHFLWPETRMHMRNGERGKYAIMSAFARNNRGYRADYTERTKVRNAMEFLISIKFPLDYSPQILRSRSEYEYHILLYSVHVHHLWLLDILLSWSNELHISLPTSHVHRCVSILMAMDACMRALYADIFSIISDFRKQEWLLLFLFNVLENER